MISFILLLLLSCQSHRVGEWNEPNLVLVGKDWLIPDPPPEGAPKPHPPYDDRWKKNDTTIVALIASFRETRCGDTLYNFFTKAAHPDRVFIGVVQQNRDDDPDCVEHYCKRMNSPLTKIGVGEYKNEKNCKHYEQVRMMRLKDTEAKGPVYARALGSELVVEKTDDYCMQIDAHTDVDTDWDVKLLGQWGAAENEFAVLTTYPTNIHDLGKNSNNHWEMPHLCQASIVGKGQVRNAQARAAANLQRPLLAPLWAAGLSFGRCHHEIKVPNDVHLKHVFNGEEYGRGSRLWTYGYDFYTITRPIVGTYYGGEKGGRGWWHTDHNELKEANERLATLLRFPGSNQSPQAVEKLGKWGLGPRRTLEQYAIFSGVDTINRKSSKGDAACIAYYVDWDDSKERAEYEKKYGRKPGVAVEVKKKETPREEKKEEPTKKENEIKPISNLIKSEQKSAETIKKEIKPISNLAAKQIKDSIGASEEYQNFQTLQAEILEASFLLVILCCACIYKRETVLSFFRTNKNFNAEKNT